MLLADTNQEVRCADCPTLPETAGSRWIGGRFSAAFWVFFMAAFFFDFGFGLFFFLFNLFLANLHYKEDVLGLVTGALTIGSVAGTIPVGMLVRRFGLQRLLLLGFIASPLICILRTLILWMPAQIGLAFLAGITLSTWPVCFSPVVARLTTQVNRASAFSIVFATGIGSGTLAGLVGGYLPALLKNTDGTNHLANSIQLVLLLSCGIAMLGILPILRLKLGPNERTEKRRFRLFHPFLFRFLPPFALWSIVTGAFTPFAAVYLQHRLRLSITNVGIIFSISQLVQFASVLLAPFLFKRVGTVIGIMCTQLAAGVALFALSRSHTVSASIIFYLAFTGIQFMSGPGLYSLLMNRLPDDERGLASAVQNVVSALSHAGVAVVAGVMLVKFGYPNVLASTAGIAVTAALLLFVLLGSIDRLPLPSAQIAKAG
jgi:MFS family permease